MPRNFPWAHYHNSFLFYSLMLSFRTDQAIFCIHGAVLTSASEWWSRPLQDVLLLQPWIETGWPDSSSSALPWHIQRFHRWKDPCGQQDTAILHHWYICDISYPGNIRLCSLKLLFSTFSATVVYVWVVVALNFFFCLQRIQAFSGCALSGKHPPGFHVPPDRFVGAQDRTTGESAYELPGSLLPVASPLSSALMAACLSMHSNRLQIHSKHGS